MKIILLISFVCCSFSILHGADSLKIVPKESFEFNSFISMGHDSLGFVTCADYVYFPFGELHSKSELISSQLRMFQVVSKLDTMRNGVFELHRLQFMSSCLTLSFDDDSEASISSYILKGQIQDKEVRFINGVHVGMSFRSFLKKFLVSFPHKVLHNCTTVIFESCVVGIRHVYSFKAGKLNEIRFECPPCTWKL
jgi:hypothetical protein